MWQLWLTRVLEDLRDGTMAFFVLPVLVISALGVAFRPTDPAPILVALVAEGTDKAPVAEKLDSYEGVDVRRVPSAAVATHEIQQGLVAAAILSVHPPEIMVDVSHPEYRFARAVVRSALSAEASPPTIEERRITSPGRRYIDFFIPGFLGFMLLGDAASVGSYLVLDRQRKLLKRYAATPMRRSHYLFGLAASRITIALLLLPFYIIVGSILFGVSVQGSVLELVGFAAFGMLMLSSIGFLLGSRAPRTEVTHSMMELVQMPQAFLCGVFFSVEKFPEWLQTLVQFLPLTAFVDGMRGIINDGVSVVALGGEVLVLAAWGLVSFAVALKIFKWQ